ncbi:pirin family protein [Desulfonatronum thioautotrophicum]|uniref:pirin family protein n=1 Tax=Desulfonatronum thioautotrophicum TaxID=617001 RepID=UPI0005EBC99F|nr:pirin family protein [Desulfonatronum thioautotrophicum]
MRREIKHIFSGEPVTEGAGVKLRRVFGYHEASLFDPFLLLDDFRSDRPEDYLKGFPWHPHRGIETITYVLQGDVTHGDSLGNAGTISTGDVQWMTAGSGIVHQEMPKGDSQGRMHGFQLWANLPAAQKMIEPRYRDITSKDIPEVTTRDGVRIKIIAGTLGRTSGPVDDVVISPEYLDCTVPPRTEFVHPTRRGHTALIYVIEGEGTVNTAPVTNRQLILFADGDELAVIAGEHSLRFLLCSGRPLGEPIAWRGPIVMNTREELEQAYQDLREEVFIKHPPRHLAEEK